MKNLLKWELKYTFKSKSFLGFGITFIMATLIFMLESLSQKGITGYDLFLRNCSNVNSLFVLIIGIYSGIHIAGSFEERRIQASVMAGNSRSNIILSKLLSYSLVIALYSVLSISISSLIGFLVTKEVGIDSFNIVIIQGLVFTLVEISFTSICLLTSILVKKLGTAITVNLIGLLALNGVAQSLIGQTWSANILKFTPIGQTFLIIGDTSTANIITAISASILGLLVTVMLTYIIFRKEELK